MRRMADHAPGAAPVHVDVDVAPLLISRPIPDFLLLHLLCVGFRGGGRRPCSLRNRLWGGYLSGCFEGIASVFGLAPASAHPHTLEKAQAELLMIAGEDDHNWESVR